MRLALDLRDATYLITVTYTMVKSRPLVTMRVISDAYRDCCAKTAKGWPDPHNSRDGR